jgi:2-polyprenyl-3-methyl-5-hydroxy-6-metoxy-1,4-benzoquinol methylase
MVSGRLEENWHSRYERWATQHQSEYQIAGWSEQGLARRLALVLRITDQINLKSGSQVLDLGTGPGTYTRALAARGHRCLGLDYSWNVINIAKSKDATGRYLQGEAYHLPFQNRAFDVVLCVGVLQSLQSPQQAMLEMQRVLKPGGYLLLDGLNGLFWLHALCRWREAIERMEKRFSYYSPFELIEEMSRFGLRETQIYWLATPQIFQPRFVARGKYQNHLIARFFGYAFLILARNES